MPGVLAGLHGKLRRSLTQIPGQAHNQPRHWGGTTNLALGRNDEVLRTGCLFVGARHVQVEPGTYRIVRLSRYAAQLFDNLGIGKCPGDSLAPEEVERILDFYLLLLEAAVAGDQE